MSNCIHECGCDCHLISGDNSDMHIRPCCDVCPLCRRRIAATFTRTHQSLCHERGGGVSFGPSGRVDLE